MSPLDTKHFWTFVVMILQFSMASSDSSGDTCQLTEITLADPTWSSCQFPHDFKAWASGCVLDVQVTSAAVFCKTKVQKCNIMTIQFGSTGVTVNANMSSEDIFVIKLNNDKSLIILNKTGVCLNDDGGAGNLCECNTFQSNHDCLGSGKVLTINLTTSIINCVNQSQSPATTTITIPPISRPSGSDSTILGLDEDFMKNLSSYAKQMGNSTVANIISGNITGVMAKLKNATNIKVGITTSGATQVIAANDVGTDLYCLVDIPAEVSSMAVNQNATIGAVVLFPNTDQMKSTGFFLGNKIIAVEMGAKINNLSQPVKLQYYNVDKEENIASCISWNGSDASNWTTDGCYLNETNSSITCECNHLTFFALLMSAPPTNISASDFKSLTYITSVGCGLSMFFLAVALFMHCLIRKGKASQATKILMNLFVAMLVLDLSFLVNESIANLGNLGTCVAIAAVMHYTMLATFSWFFVEALHIYFNIWRSLTEVKHYMTKIGVTGWGTPAVVVVVLLALQKYGYVTITINDGGSSQMCWITDAFIHNVVNVGYYAVVFIVTFVVFITTVRQLVVWKLATGKAQQSISVKSKIFSILALVFLLGITWAFAFFSYGPLLIPSYYIFTILNSFQGFFLFIYYYNTSKIVVDDRSLKAKEGTDATSKTAVTVFQ